MKYRHFSCEKESNFSKLSGDVQRAIETQANIDVEAHKLSRFYGHVLKDDETETGLFNMICQEYAEKSDIELKKLVILDSKALYYYPMTKDRMGYYETLAKERAERMDNNIRAQTCMHFKDYNTGR